MKYCKWMWALSLTVGCAPTLEPDKAGTVPADTGPQTTAAPEESDADTDADADADTDTDTDTDSGGVEVLPPTQSSAVVSPPPGLFVDSLTIELESANDAGEVHACVGSPRTVCALSPTDSVTLDGSGVLYARVVVDSVEGPISAFPYVQVDDEVAAFTSNLPIVVAWTDEAQDDFWVNSPVVLLTFDDPSGRTDLTAPADVASRARLRIRGSSSAGLDKKNFDLELWAADSSDDAAASMFGMPEDGDWVLHAPSYFDDALIRNALGYALSRDIGRYAPRTVFSEMFLAVGNRTLTYDQYIGVYVVTEEIERGPDRVDVERLDEDDTAWPEVTGGYVFKRDREGEPGEGFYAGDGGGAYSFMDPIVPVDPESDDLEREQFDYLRSELDALGDALASSDGVDPTSGRPWRDIVDQDSFVDHHILAVLVKNPDAFRLSGYFHKDREQPIIAGPIWDLDRTAGSIDSRARDPYRWDATNETTDTTPIFTYGWYGPMFDDAAFRALYWARWQTLMAGPLSPLAVAQRIDDMRTELSEAGPRNNTRWGAPDWNGELDTIDDWYAARLGWIDDCIDAHSDPRVCAGPHTTP